eukprot:489370_1
MVMQIFVELPDSKNTITIDCEPNDTILQIKLKIQDKLGDPPEIMHLNFSKRLSDHRTLSDYNIQKESFIRLNWNFTAIESRRIAAAYKHNPSINDCPLMKQNDDEKVASCPVYDRLKKYQYSQQDLEHMQTYSHCKLKYIECKYGAGCKAYKRLVEGGNRVDDRCHLAIFAHPPRVDRKKSNLPQGFHSFVFNNDGKCKTSSFYRREARRDLHLSLKPENELLHLLMNEVKINNFGDDLVMPNGHSLIEIVDEKLKHPRHIAMKSPLNKPLMLSIILYTGCQCNYDLCAAQRNGNFKKWVIFDYCLSCALTKLKNAEYGEYPVYTGVGNVMIDFKKKQSSGFLSTFTSTSWDKKVAERFCGPYGMIVALESNFRKWGADISWISKFGQSEKEILFDPESCWISFNCVSQTNKMQRIVGNRGGNVSEKLF